MSASAGLDVGADVRQAWARIFSVSEAARRYLPVRARYIAEVLAIAAGYYVFAEGGKALLLTGPAGAFWPAAGLAIAVMYLGGLRWWPAILLGDVGSLLGDVLSDELAVPVGSALAQAVGDMAGLLVAAIILRRLIGPRGAMDRLEQVGAMVVAVATGAAISAAVAMVSVRAGGLISTSDMSRFWRSWWLGDLAGGLVVIPLALAWARPPAWRSRVAAEGGLMIVSVIALSAIAVSAHQPLAYLVFPGFIWAALRFGPRGATLAVAVAVVIAVWAASNALGSFTEHSPTASALSLQLYIAVAALTTLCLAVIVSERERVSSQLAESRARAATAAAHERRRIEGELHDSAQNRLVALILHLGLAREKTERSAPEIATTLAGLIRDAEGVGEELRRVTDGRPPPRLATDGLVGALRAECAASAIDVEIAADEIEPSAREVELAVYLCCLEAVQNASKHAGAGAAVKIDLLRKPEAVAFRVHDTGNGFHSRTGGSRARLTSSQARIRAVGGRVAIVAAPGSGTTVAGLVPWPPRES
jgi:signal transduction histidine kinase